MLISDSNKNQQFKAVCKKNIAANDKYKLRSYLFSVL